MNFLPNHLRPNFCGQNTIWVFIVDHEDSNFCGPNSISINKEVDADRDHAIIDDLAQLFTQALTGYLTITTKYFHICLHNLRD
jgi:hypothetical protein